jgi:hypothetical protein
MLASREENRVSSTENHKLLEVTAIKDKCTAAVLAQNNYDVAGKLILCEC